MSLPNITDWLTGILRLPFRVFIGTAAGTAKGTFNKFDGSTIIGDPGGPFSGFWFERNAQVIIGAEHGGGLFCYSAKSLRYPPGTKPYKADTDYFAGDHIGWQGRLYAVPANGHTNATWAPPTHTSGDAVDGTLTLTFVEFSQYVPIPYMGAVIADFSDGHATWISNTEAGRVADGGTVLAHEHNVWNDGNAVPNFPNAMSPDGATVLHWSGTNRSSGVLSANPSTMAHGVIKGASGSSQGFLRAFGIGWDAIAPGGYGFISGAKAEHAFGWFNAANQLVSMLYSLATNNNERAAQVFGNRNVSWYFVGGLGFTMESASPAGTPSQNRIRAIADVAAGASEIRVTQNATGAPGDLVLNNGGYVRLGAFQPITTETIVGFIPVKDAATGTVRKLAVVGP